MNAASTHIDGEETLKLLAAGLVRQHRACVKAEVLDARGANERTLTPLALLMAQARISRLQIASGQLASADSLHRLVANCMLPLGEWAPALLLGVDGAWRDLRLIDPELRVPTLECRGLAEEGGNVDDLRENVWHAKVREELKRIPLERVRDEAYRTLRRFVVTHALARQAELDAAVSALDDLTLGATLGPLLAEMYTPAHAGEHGRLLERCAACGSRVEVRGGEPRCASERCRERAPVLSVRDVLTVEEAWLLKRELLLFWAEPGQVEIALFDALRAQRDDVELYPRQDEVDVSVGEGRDVGIDVKDYTLIPQLARRFDQGAGDLALYRRKIVVVTDRGTRARGLARRRQLQELLDERELGIEVMTVHQAVDAFGYRARTGRQ
ncbi:restriction endonuclease-related protein [Deinococcus arcticus]|uniref:REase associating with pPIWI RE domain-containing protein n=1 Tax=Deinococcus arcticus TaxID=2136176 RepID=A0A2T3W6G8_9DEIO|nr:hypothetical protein [Deinococcus arcticus]PTA67374.1 hypothetical protein C8263_12415 [Deinococcus arcticus]